MGENIVMNTLVQFSKLHGIGNDFIVIDASQLSGVVNRSKLSIGLCDRQTGIGADGILLLSKSSDQLKMEVINSDGSKPEMCGNGLRVAALWMHEQGWADCRNFDIQTGAGELSVEIGNDGNVTIDMGMAKLNPREIGMSSSVQGDSFINQSIGGGMKGSAVSMGNPHLIIQVSDFARLNLEDDGRLLETHPFFPLKTNVHFVQIVNRRSIVQKTWERGAGATLACGTGACASVVAIVEQGLVEREVHVELPGGNLTIKYEKTGHVFMTGPAEFVFTGSISLPAFLES